MISLERKPFHQEGLARNFGNFSSVRADASPAYRGCHGLGRIMTQDRDAKTRISELRRRAESFFATKAVDAGDVSALSSEEVQKLVHELQVHQIELEMQNEELRTAQVVLEDSRSRYQDLYDFAPVGYLTLDDKGLLLEANLTAVRLLEVERPTLINKPLARFVCREFGDVLHLHLQEAFKSLSKQTSEIELAKQDGTHFHAQLQSIGVQEENGEFSRCRTIVTDISERKRAEKVLRESEKRFKSMFQLHDAVMLLIEPETGQIIDANLSAQRFYGYQVPEIIGMSIQQINTLSPDEIAKERQKALSRERNSFMFPHRLANGEVRTVEVHSSPIDLEGKRILFSVIHDITESKNAEEALRDSEAKFKQIFNSSNVGKSLTLPTGELNVNKAFCDLLGYTQEELESKTWQEFTPPEDWGAIQEMLNQLLKGEKDSTRFNKRYVHKNGSYIWADVSVAIRRDHEGKPLHFITTVVDITDRKQAEEELKRKMCELERFNSTMVGRELRMIELKKEVNELLKKAGQSEKYRIVQ